jgi:cyclic-di-AMP phosphodiesterase PgpH
MALPKEGSSLFVDLWHRMMADPVTPRWAIAAAAYLLILAVTANHLIQPNKTVIEVGKVANKNYSAPFSSYYIDSTATKEAGERAANEVPPVYSIDSAINATMTLDYGNFFLTLDDSVKQLSVGGGGASSVQGGLETAAVNRLRKQLDNSLKIQLYFVEPVSDQDFRSLLEMDKASRDSILDVIDRSIKEQITSEVIFETDLPKVLGTLLKTILDKAEKANLNSTQTRIAGIIAGYFIRPNSMLDQSATDLAKQQAKDATPAVQKEVRQGQVFLRQGEIVNQEDVDILDALGINTSRGIDNAWLAVLLFAAILASAFVFGVIYLPGPTHAHLNNLKYYLLLFSIVTISYLASFFLLEQISSRSEGQPATMLLTLSSLPILAAAVLLAHYFSRIVAATVSGLLGVVITLAAGDPAVLLPALLPSLVASLIIKRDAPRSQSMRTIVILPVIWVAALLGQAYSSGLDLTVLQRVPWLLLYGFIPAPIAMIFANYILDGAFNVPTANRLREFDTPDHPLLKRLQLEASGTWHHSMMVGVIAEAACQALGGNNLLTRISCMYHDIGKIRRPEFFVENQFSGMNVHDKYSPWLSKIIIESHVKDGVTMAKAHGLPDEMIEMIPQHHGTSLITYFFRKALAMSEDGYVNEYDYRYPGPKPQSLEAACINLADACESATRTLEDPTPHRIESLVHRIYEERLLDGQYDECGLALNQLDTIKTIITERLIGAYHARIEYPEEEELRRQFQLKRAEAVEKPARKESSNGDE